MDRIFTYDNDFGEEESYYITTEEQKETIVDIIYQEFFRNKTKGIMEKEIKDCIFNFIDEDGTYWDTLFDGYKGTIKSMFRDKAD